MDRRKVSTRIDLRGALGAPSALALRRGRDAARRLLGRANERAADVMPHESIPEGDDGVIRAACAHGARPADTMLGVNPYSMYLSDADIAAGVHRAHVGGMWEEIGRHQFEYLIAQGLRSNQRFLDVGCGAMRGGIHFARYLQPDHYFGIDIDERLIEAALRVELPAAELVERVSPANLRVTECFDADFGFRFDFALAQSVFSHLPLNHIRLCLAQVGKVMAPGGRFFATFFYVPDDVPYDQDFVQVATTTHATRDPFHYRVHELQWAAELGGWEFIYIGDWGHPRGQQMVEFRWRG